MEVENSSKWVAGGGTTALGIIGTVLGGIATVSGGSSVLGGWGGGNCNGNNAVANENTKLRSQVAQLTSEKYTDNKILAERDRHLGWVERLANQDARLEAVSESVEKMAIKNQQDIVALKENIVLQNTIDNKDAEIKMLTLKNDLNGKIDAVASSAAQGIQANAGAITCLQNAVAGITKTVIPKSAVCNTAANGCCQSAVQQ